MKLYKFRPLGNKPSLDDAKKILETGEFWCSHFWKLNDPMEGVYSFTADDGFSIEDLFSRKAQRVICSFSGQKAFSNPAMWGYYANGFKGIAIEIEVSPGEVQEMTYAKNVPKWSKTDGSDLVEEILTTKLSRWKHEDEYRFLDGSDKPGPRKIGKITKVHFGNPYGKIANRGDIIKKSKELREFFAYRTELEELAKSEKISSFRVNVDGGKVVQQS